MKKTFALLMIIFALGCNSAKKNTIQTGDLLFVAIPEDYDLLGDKTATSDKLNYIHTAILDVDSAGIWIIDATIKHGVARYPLDTFLTDFTLKDGSLPTFEIMRLKDNSNAAKYVVNTKNFIGEVYDVDFAADNNKHYCTELIYDAYKNENQPIFSYTTLDFQNEEGIIPDYWQKLFGLLGMSVPQGKSGILPAQMRQEKCLIPVNADLLNYK